MIRSPQVIRLVGASSLLISPLFAGTTWDGGGGDDNWSTANNWDPDGSPPVGSTVDLTFAGAVRLTSNNDYTAWDDFRSILFASGASSFTLTGNAVDLFGKIENNSSVTQTVSLAAFSFNSGSAELNPVSGNLVINSADIFTNGNTINVWGNNGHTLTVNGAISQGGGLTVNQNSNVVLNGANTYTGTTTISAGSLSIGNGGTTGSFGTGTVTNNASLILNRSNDFTVANNIGGSGTLTKLGAGVATLGGTNTFTGKTIINAGTLAIDADSRLGTAPGSFVADQISLNGGALRITGAASVTLSSNRGITLGASGGTLDNAAMAQGLNANFNQVISGTGPLALRANGNTSDTGGGVGGNLTLGNAANTFTGDVTIHSGIVNFAGNGSFGAAANDIILAGGGLVATANQTLAATRDLVLSGGGDRIFRAYGGVTFTINGAITGSGNVRHTDGGTLQLNGNNSFTGNLLAAGGAGRVIALGGTNTYTGYTHLFNSSTLRLDANNALPDTTGVLMYGGTTFNANGRTDTLRGLFVGGSGDTTATVNLGASGSTGTLTITNTSMAAGAPTNVGGSFYAKVSGFGNVEYNHSASDTATWDWLNTANDNTGNIVITRGRLRTALGVGGVGALGNAANDIVFNGDVVTSLANGLGKASFQGAASGALTFGADRSIILNSGKEGTMYVWGGNTYTINGQVTGGGNLRKEDGGVLLLTNTTNNYTGLTRIAQGTIRVGTAGVIPDASSVEIAGGNLDLNATNESVASLFGNGGAVNGGGTLTVLTSGSANYSGVIQNATTLRMAGTGTQTISGTADNGNGWARVDSGTLVLAKASSATVHAVGRSNDVGLTIAGGTARLAGTGNDQIYTEVHVNQTGGVFDFNGTSEGFRALTGTGGTVRNDLAATASTMTVGETSLVTDTYSYSGVIADGAGTMSLTKVGAGTQILNGANTYTGNTTITGGKLALGSSGSIASSNIIVGASTTLDVSAAGTWTLTSGQTLQGTGTVVGDIAIDGDLRPGTSPGALSITGNLGLGINSETFIELGGLTTGDYDQLLVSGLLTADGVIRVSFVNSFNAAANDSFQIATFNSFAGSSYSFDFTNAVLDPGLTWDTSTFATNGTILVAVPEPGVPLLAGIAALTLVFRRRRVQA
jgi:fibronectin-binding autotransporter adhesin